MRSTILMIPQRGRIAMSERRKAPRSRVLKSGKIIIAPKAPAIACTIRNLSDAGALLIVESSTYGIPTLFELVIGNGPRLSCRTVRRDQTSIAIEFIAQASEIERSQSA